MEASAAIPEMDEAEDILADIPKVKLYFSEYFDVDAKVLEEYGAFNVSLVKDLPLFIDPFRLFHSGKPEYRALHTSIIRYVTFLKNKAQAGEIPQGLLRAWFTFPEVKQTWLGYSMLGNNGSGLGPDFAKKLCESLRYKFPNFGEESISEGSHLEKLCLIDEGVGRDNVSDFATNLIKQQLLQYTQEFALKHLKPVQRRKVTVEKVVFNYETETWEAHTFVLPYINNDYVILTPRDLLTKDRAWINRDDLLGNIDEIANAVPDEQLRLQLSNYFQKALVSVVEEKDKEPTEKQRREAAAMLVDKFPVLVDYFIKWKEERGDQGEALSKEKVEESEMLLVAGVQEVVNSLARAGFYKIAPTTLEEARQRVMYLKDVIEKRDGYRLFYMKDGKPIRREEDLQILYLLTWNASTADVNREVNNGRGPVDFKISRGAADKALVEFKLAKNTKLKQNLKNQVRIYEEANDTKNSLTVIVYFTESKLLKVQRILKELGLENDSDIILIDARSDNKPSASNA